MDDVADVRLVDAHAEGVRRDHNRPPVELEVVLIAPPLLLVQSRVVARGRDARVLQRLADALDRGARRAVDDAAAPHPLAHEGEERPVLAARGAHFKIQVRPVKARHLAQRAAQAEQAPDVLLHPRRRGRGERGRHGALRERVDEIGDLQIARAEILPPLGDAVRLVDGDERDGDRLRQLHKTRRAEPLGRDIEQAVLPAIGAAVHVAQLLARERTVDIPRRDGAEHRDALTLRRRDARVRERRDLILHQRDERRDDQRRPAEAERRDLVAH